MNANVWEPHAPSRAGDDVPVIANFFFSFGGHPASLHEDRFGDGAETSTRSRSLQSVAVPCCLTK
jgi:hypothetical protein